MDADRKIVDKHLSVPRTAKALGIATGTVARLVAKGILTHDIVSDRIAVHRDSIDAYLAEHPRPETPARSARPKRKQLRRVV